MRGNIPFNGIRRESASSRPYFRAPIEPKQPRPLTLEEACRLTGLDNVTNRPSRANEESE